MRTFITRFLFLQINVRTKLQTTWHLYKQSLCKCYYVYKDDINFKKQSRQKTQEDETLVFQKIMHKIQTYKNPIEQNNDHTRKMHKIQFRNSFKVYECLMFIRGLGFFIIFLEVQSA